VERFIEDIFIISLYLIGTFVVVGICAGVVFLYTKVTETEL
jgi:hypothetical protein